MPTDNPKISLYVPQQIYDRFKEFQEQQGLSMSQAGIVILAEYFGIEEIIKEITEGTTIGGVSLAEFEQLKQKVEKLEKTVFLGDKKVEKIKYTSEPLTEAKEQNSTPQLELLSELSIEPLSGILLSKRFGMKKNGASDNKRRKTIEQFAEWSQSKDPDGIAWIPSGKKYVPKDELSEDLKNKLLKWIAEN